MEDAEIIALYYARMEEAILESRRKYGPLCRMISIHILGSPEDAEECLSDTWRKAWNTIPPEHPRSLKSYLAKITRNLSIDRFRASRATKRNTHLEILLSELDDCIPAASDTEKMTESREIIRILNGWLQTLKPEERKAFLRRYWYGLSVEEIAEATGCSANTMTKRLSRLRNRLKDTLEKEGIEL